ncbi:C39 family peptidase [Collimonas pratensis]|uniref:Peptidase_C39 like family protein n=1 Tax=Collimonas pratensis TaxID=279113 RepID=A0A127Q4H2_9BURK|nr:C39 family peptidase [Collimonas pratensis]AMP04934.1 peptidase_C39 like family protein [Collimonas pratensis]
MIKTLRRMIAGACLVLMAPMAFAASKTLNVPLVTQEHSEWCWAGSSKAVLNFYRKTPSQCNIVNWAFGINYACGNSRFNWNSQANQPNGMYGNNGSVQDILSYWGVPNKALSNYLSWAHVVSDINANRPFVMRYGWTSGGGHIVVGRGYEILNGVNYLYIMNPWPGEGMTYGSYDSTVADDDHQWTHTQRMNING